LHRRRLRCIVLLRRPNPAIQAAGQATIHPAVVEARTVEARRTLAEALPAAVAAVPAAVVEVEAVAGAVAAAAAVVAAVAAEAAAAVAEAITKAQLVPVCARADLTSKSRLACS
jgi:hypothetical protein